MQDNEHTHSTREGLSRRAFLKTSAAAGAASVLSYATFAHAQGSDKIRVGLIGCGGRGTGAGIIDCASSSEGVELVALGDLFQDQLDSAPERIKANLAHRNLPVDEIYKVTPDAMFVGFDAYKKVLACDLDMVILTTPPYFRPAYYKAAIEAGKHVFAEKPVAVDPTGVRDFIATSKLATEKGLCVVAGTQMRRARHIMAVVEQIRKGALGEVVSGQCVRRGGGMLDWYAESKEKPASWSEMEWQIRRWLFMTWLSGDFIVEMHVHNLDLLNWAMGANPVECMAQGGRQVRTAPEYGNVYDHFSAEYEYPNGVRVEYMGCQIDGVSTRNDLWIVGGKGKAYIDFGASFIEGEHPFRYDGPSVEPAIQEYADLITAIRAGTPINEGQQVAESTMTAIIGRMSAYTGRAMKWDWAMNASKLDLGPEKLEFGDLPLEPVAIPGLTKLV
ncbi:MAG TPA: Gfo/Idh/MocA family oxidoreductase [Candidatus Hydrogenedentes bacterium]|nr:Gfo/Idh/MocA family oxidoreductase [Candidatus Hydrogenedentota bacterium]HPG67847.1 Gfo/Idh/MocA family oxidoreductase [Candidatus Hydrogenedentota bacterium]